MAGYVPVWQGWAHYSQTPYGHGERRFRQKGS